MPSISVQLLAGQRISILDEAENAKLIDIDNQRDEAGNLVVTDHVLIPNRFGCNEISDDIAAYSRDDPVDVLPATTLPVVASKKVLPALLKCTGGNDNIQLHLVA